MDIEHLLVRLRVISDKDLRSALTAQGLSITGGEFITAFNCVSASHDIGIIRMRTGESGLESVLAHCRIAAKIQSTEGGMVARKAVNEAGQAEDLLRLLLARISASTTTKLELIYLKLANVAIIKAILLRGKPSPDG